MQPNKASETDRAVAVEPPIEPRAAWRVRDVRVISHGVLDVQFVDGTRGTVDLRPRLGPADVVGTVVEPLREASFFALAAVHLGDVEWPGGIDLAPDLISDAIPTLRK